MKKILSLAVAVIMMTLCAVMFVGCGENYTEGNRVNPTPEPEKIVDKIGCVPGEAGETKFSYNGVVEKATTRGINFDTPVVDGKFTATTPLTTYFINTPDSVLEYTADDVIEVIEVNKPRYVRNMSCMASATLKRMVSGEDIFWGCTFNDGADHALDFGLREKWICKTLEVRDPINGGTKKFESCDNRIKDLRIIGVDSIDGRRDSAEYHLMYGYVLFQATYANDAVGKFRVKISTWKYIGGGMPEWPDGRQPVKYFYKNRWLKNISLYRIDSFMDLWVLYSDGTEADVDDQSIDLIDEVLEPELLVKEVEELTWKAEKAVPYDETANGARFEKKANIFVTPLIKMYAVKVDHGTQTYTLKREGRPVYISPLGDELEFLEPTWAEQDLGWNDSKLSDLDIFERTLLTNSAVFTLNEQDITANAKIELRKVKEGDEIADLYCVDFGLDLITPIGRYYSHADLWSVSKKGKKSKLGTIGTYIGASVIEPQEQTIPVPSWDLKDLNYQSTHTRSGLRKDTTATKRGYFLIEEWETDYKTVTDAPSKCAFKITCDEKVTFVDEKGNKWEEFLALKPTITDKGGIKNGLEDLGTVNDQERKKMISTINLKVNNENANYHGVVISTKEVEKEELLDWTVTKDLIDKGNGLWDTKADIVYTWKLKGTEHDPITQELDCSFKGEPKSHVILDKAEAPFNASNFNSAWSGETSSNPQQYVTLYTKTKSVSEDYTTLTDRYTAQMQRAVIKKVVGGKEIVVEMLAPSDMTFSHNEGNLVDGKRTTTDGGITYDVYDHTGSVTATVTGNGKSQDQSATDKKEIWVKHEEPIVEPEHPEWGRPVAIIGLGTHIYRPGVGASGQGVFHENFNVLYENGILCLHTVSHVTSKNTNPMDFTYDEGDFYKFGEKLRGVALKKEYANDFNSAIWRDGKFEIANCSYVEKGPWTYTSPDTYSQGMTQQLAETCGLKNFTGNNTAYLKPWLYFSSSLSSDGVLTIMNSRGGVVMRLR